LTHAWAMARTAVASAALAETGLVMLAG
jgi:hypothetical protein